MKWESSSYQKGFWRKRTVAIETLEVPELLVYELMKSDDELFWSIFKDGEKLSKVVEDKFEAMEYVEAQIDFLLEQGVIEWKKHYKISWRQYKQIQDFKGEEDPLKDKDKKDNKEEKYDDLDNETK